MTYIELFDRTAVENLAAFLAMEPERVLFVGSKLPVLEANMKIYETVAREHDLKTEFLKPKTVSESNLQAALRVIQEIVDRYEDCVFDLTGGEEILCLALGMICQRNPKKKIGIYKFHLNNNMVEQCDPNGNKISFATPDMTVRDQIRIYGGDIVYGSVESSDTYRWELTETLCKQIAELWEICKSDMGTWNSQLTTLYQITQAGKRSDEGRTYTANLNVVSSMVSKINNVFVMDEELLNTLVTKGYLTAWSRSTDTVSVSYRDLETKRLISKAGTILEMKIFATAMCLRDSKGKYAYQDGETGVMIDWDGKHHTGGRQFDEDGNLIVDTENEVDVLLMHGAVPIFISCKNGGVNEEELYKFNTVAERFGNKYVKKVLVVNGLPQRNPKAEHIRRRAADMGITLIERVQFMTENQLEEALNGLWR